jgi:hypothetical protein
MNPPWGNWYHCTCSTYGTWLRGDPRGWRARHHREDCDGDYKNRPPKGKFDKLYELSKRLMKRDPVYIEVEIRAIVVEEFVNRLEREQIEVIIAGLDDHHLHILLGVIDHNPRHWLGLAKKHTSHILRELELAKSEGGIWAKRSKAIPIRDRAHQLNVVGYILGHEKRGAAIKCIPQVRKWDQRRKQQRRRK